MLWFWVTIPQKASAFTQILRCGTERLVISRMHFQDLIQWQ